MSLTVLFFCLLGVAFGSFGNVLLYRLHKNESILGRSKCTTCKRTLGIVDLVPVLSYVFLGGKCRTCGKHISLQYPLVEILSAFLFGLSAVLFPANIPVALLTAFLLYFLFLASVFDIFYQQLPDIFTIIIAALAVAISLFSGEIMSSLFGGLLVFVWFSAQWILSRGKAIGSGDIFLGFALGVWLGFYGAISMLFFSYVVGAMIVLFLLGFRIIHWNKQRIAFGPFLAIGALLTLLGAGQSYLHALFGG